ncbi:MAG TPA: Kdo hydroxylase family protein [Acidobacteriaceae bacterium]|nr:Kdo hydroxylase family protein [Acidobacteriaceae bacterium]
MNLVTISQDPVDKLKNGVPPSPEQARSWCRELEAGNILFFPQTPIQLAQADLDFLLQQEQSGSSLHKNIAYKPRADKISGDSAAGAENTERLRGIMRAYSSAVEKFLAGFLAPYQRRWKLDYASFRPQEEQNRNLPLRRRNDLLHTDAFPTRPTYGARILRFFNNIHPTRTRDWVTSDTFDVIAPRYAPREIALPRPFGTLTGTARKAAQAAGLGKVLPQLKRSPYDDFMMRFHNFLKENEAFQQTCTKYEFKLPPGSSWMVYTDSVPHAVLAGQYALEQTFLIDREAMVAPQLSPLGVLEKLTGATLSR